MNEKSLDGKMSPWGRIDCSEEIAEGIWQVMTAGHGGIWISGQRRQAMPKELREWVSKYGDTKNGWYEEDCDWVVPCLAFPEQFGDRSYQIALSMVRSKPDYYPTLEEPTLTGEQRARLRRKVVEVFGKRLEGGAF